MLGVDRRGVRRGRIFWFLVTVWISPLKAPSLGSLLVFITDYMLMFEFDLLSSLNQYWIV